MCVFLKKGGNFRNSGNVRGSVEAHSVLLKGHIAHFGLSLHTLVTLT